MKNNKHLWVMVGILLCMGQLAFAQDIEKDLKEVKNLKWKTLFKNGIKITGGITANHTYYHAWGNQNRRVPFFYLYSGNLNTNVLGKVNIPISFSFTNQNANFNTPFGGGFPRIQPFNRLLFKPRYKGSTFHLGTSALSFSQNTLNGFRFNGFGYEYNSPKSPIYGSFMYGRLFKAILVDSSLSGLPNRPVFRRMGVGGKLGYKKNEDKLEVIYFQAQDVASSLPYRLDALNLFPESNIALSVSFQKVLFKNLFVSGEIARTKIFVENQTQGTWAKIKQTLGNSRQNNNQQAIKTNLKYKHKEQEYGFEYSRIDPRYRTFGGYFFNADLETFALKTSNQWLQGKLNLNADWGYQRGNLQKDSPQSLDRWVWAIDTYYAPNDKTSLSLNYSTFSNFTNFQNNFQYLTALEPFQQLDTLNYRQVNNSISASLTQALPTKNNSLKKTISLNAIYQSGIDQQGSTTNKNSLNNLSINYGIANEKQQKSYNIGLNLVQNNRSGAAEFMLGPLVSFNQGLFKNKATFTTLFSYTRSTGTQFEGAPRSNNGILLARTGLQAMLFKQHRLDFSVLLLRSSYSLNANRNLTEATVNLGYAYQIKPITIKPKS